MASHARANKMTVIGYESNIGRRRAVAQEGASANYVDRRQEILRAAAEVFKRRGFGRTTLNDVANETGIDRASLYYYFASKEELFQELVMDAVEMNLTIATAIRDGPGTAAEKLRRLVEEIMQKYASQYPVLYVLIQENLRHVAPEHSGWAARMRELTHEYENVVIELVETGRTDGTLRPIAPAWLIAYGILGTVSWTHRWFNPSRSAVSADEIGGAYAEMLLEGLVTKRSRRQRARHTGGRF